ncbi:MAG: 4Fe-4S ferredoxin [Deltaproteobacteria bacterium]|jgi:Pyruvate/2-oxoacid:ferredoxin oxidoreductase delta subunit|nr:4Fe-4S ferredoxin [Deltaproteobacteria bacterium]
MTANTQGQTAKDIHRDIIEINEALCDGCGDCASACAEGAIAIVDGKAKLVSETYCDGLGACLSSCPTGALKVVRKASPAFDPAQVASHLKLKGKTPAPGCPGAAGMRISPKAPQGDHKGDTGPVGLVNWPIQLGLVNPGAAFLDAPALIVAADCTAFAAPSFHGRFLGEGLPLVMGCPKLGDIDELIEKIAQILAAHPRIGEIRVPIMEVPCCRGLIYAVAKAIAREGSGAKARLFVVARDGSVEEELPQGA